MNNISIGQIGEKLASKYLKKLGYKILTNNYHNALGEIDIIAQDKDTTVFVEVKMRSSLSMGYPREAVEFHKQNKIRTVATQYLKSNQLLESNCRFDVVEIIGDSKDYTMDHFKDAF